MGHAAEGSLQAYLDGEIDSGARSRLSDHLAACVACASELSVLRHNSELTHGALARLDAPAPMLRARAALAGARSARSRRFAQLGLSSFAKAAMLLLALAGAGVAAMPGSPVRRALEATVARVAQLLGGADAPVAPVAEPDVPAPVPATPAAPAVERQYAAVPGADGSVRVLLHSPSGNVDVTVRLTDAERANVETLMEDGAVRFVSGNGRLEVIGLATGSVVIEFPRSLQNATVQINGLVHVYKQGDQLQLSGPAGDGQGNEVRFDIGS